MKLRLDKIASSTRNVRLFQDVVVGDPIPAKAGTIVAVRVLDTKAVYNKVEDLHGRMMSVKAGDIVAGVLGARQALRGYAGIVPPKVERGDILHLLNLGGVIGECTSANPEVGPPCRVEVLGAVLRFPELGRRVGVPASIFPGPVAMIDELPAGIPPVVWVAGTCMHAGKTAAACIFIREASRRGLKIAATKVTGVALRRDSLEMSDNGAIAAVTFADAGIPSTTGIEVGRIARSCIAALEPQGADLLVVELGDGLMGTYGVDTVLRDEALKALPGALVLAANDPVGAWGGVKWLEREGWRPAVITGPSTDNTAGSERIQLATNVPAINARSQSGAFTDAILAAALGPNQ